MADPFVAEIRMFPFNFAPRGWALCSGALLPIAQNTALFSLIGVTYGGNGQTTFALPNLGGRAACQQGQGPGLSPRSMGEQFGAATVTLTSNQIPQHNHGVNAYVPANSNTPVSNGGLSQPSQLSNRPFVSGAPNTTLAPNMIQTNQGGGQPHENRQPYLAVNFSIALQGIFPSFP